MSDIAISVENLSKRYLIGHQSAQRERYTALRDVVGREMRNFVRKAVDLVHGRPIIQGDEVEDLWALRNVSFEVKRGDVVGIIGRNGAGKSTLLKILSRITDPSEGLVRLRGRVGSLLEVGTGFHPELTGRENIFLNGAILGMGRKEIARKFDAIVAFAEIERFLDTPVKRYSSGMYIRLAFSVAAHLEPDILIVDEVLAVGDGEFQKKCLGKLNTIAKVDARTVLLVSHNMAAIQTLCSTVIYLRSGQVASKGDVSKQIGAYLNDQSNLRQSSTFSPRKLSSLLTLDSFLLTPNPVEFGRELNFAIQISAKESTQIREVVVLIFSGLGTRVAILDLRSSSPLYDLRPGRSLNLRGKVHALPFVEGDYSVGLYINSGDLNAEILDLANVTVTRTYPNAEFTPYDPRNQGVVELSHEFSPS